MKAIAYIRVSTTEQAESGLGLDAQRAKVTAMAEVKDFELVEVIADEGASAKDMAREGLREVMAQVKGKVVDAVIVAKLDRLTRNLGDLRDMVHEFNRRGVALISTGESLDTGSATGRAMIHLLGLFSEWEREVIGERTSEALQALKARGKRTGVVPYGHAADEEGNLSECEHEQAVIGRMIELREAGNSYEAVSQALAADGIRNRAGGVFTRSGIHRLLKGLGYGKS